MPCLDRFAEQDEAYREHRAAAGPFRARVSVEAAAPLGWDRGSARTGDVDGMTTFGASGPSQALYEHFGFTPENVAERARAVIERASAAGLRGAAE